MRLGASPAKSRRTPSADRINLRKLIKPIINGALRRLTTGRRFGPKRLSFQFVDDFCGAQRNGDSGFRGI